jgi:hypothetical protein
MVIDGGALVSGYPLSCGYAAFVNWQIIAAGRHVTILVTSVNSSVTDNFLDPAVAARP